MGDGPMTAEEEEYSSSWLQGLVYGRYKHQGHFLYATISTGYYSPKMTIESIHSYGVLTFLEPDSLVSREIRFAVTTYCDNEQDKAADTASQPASQMGWNIDTSTACIRRFPELY